MRAPISTRTRTRPTLILHIGLPKTATTFLQYHIFKPTFGEDFFHWKTDLTVRLLRKAAQHPELTGCQDMRELSQWLSHLYSGRSSIITCENISSQGRGFWSGSGPSPRQIGSTLRTLQEMAGIADGDLKIILGVRRQDHMLASRYAQYAAENKKYSQADFEERVHKMIARTSPKPGHLWLYYDKVLHDFEDIFGGDNVFLFSQEALNSSPFMLLDELGRFCNSNFCPALEGAKGLMLDKSVNKKSVGPGKWMLGSSGASLVLTVEVQEAILRHFERSNAAFEIKTRYNLDLTPNTSGV